MQISPIVSDGLKRSFRVTLARSAVEDAAAAKLKAIGDRVTMPGFRPGKAPAALLKKQYGGAVMSEVLQEQIESSLQKTVEQHNVKPATQPKVADFKDDGAGDLEYTLEMEILPEIDPGNLKGMKLERQVADVPDAEVDSAMQRLANQQKQFEKVEEARPAANGDALLIDFVGSVDGVNFEGGSANDFTLELGSGMFIPGFEDQLVGVQAGESRTVQVTFPEAYANQSLAGKPASFAVTVKELRAAKPVVVDEEFAKRLGLDSVDALRQGVRRQMEQEFASYTRMRLKRQLLDKLAENHTFAVPPSMVDMEFEQIWNSLQGEGQAAAERAKSGKSEEQQKAEYRAIAERRVRLGLLLAEIGRRNNIEVKADEVNRAILEQARRYPGQEKQVVEFFRKNEAAANQLRAPIFEDKVVDFIVELAEVTESKVPPADLVRDPDEAAA